MWADYVRERQGKEVKKWKNSFSIYSYPGDGLCYIEDIYVEKDFREKGIAAGMAKEIEIEARGKKCHTLIGSVDVKANGATSSMKVLLAYGMAPYHTEGSVVYFRKDI